MIVAGSAQRNYRFPLPLLERLERAVPARRRSAFVRDAVEERLDRVAPVSGAPVAELFEGGFEVVSVPGSGTLIRVEASESIPPGAVLVSALGERIRVRDSDGGLLTVDRGVDGSRVARIGLGDRLVPVEDFEASPAVAGGDGAVASGPGNRAASLDGARAGSAAAVRDAAARPSAAAASVSFEPVELAPALAAVSGEPAMVWRSRIERGRVTVAGRLFKAQSLDRSQLEFVELDGERVAP